MFLENKILEFSAVRICRSSHIFLFLFHSYNIYGKIEGLIFTDRSLYHSDIRNMYIFL